MSKPELIVVSYTALMVAFSLIRMLLSPWCSASRKPILKLHFSMHCCKKAPQFVTFTQAS